MNAKFRLILVFDEAVQLVFLERFVGYGGLCIGFVEVTQAYERRHRVPIMDLKPLLPSILSMSRHYFVPTPFVQW